MAITTTQNTQVALLDDQIVRRMIAAAIDTIVGVDVYMPTQTVDSREGVYARVTAIAIGDTPNAGMNGAEDRQSVELEIHVTQPAVDADGDRLADAPLWNACAIIRKALTGLTLVDQRAEGLHQLELGRCVARDLINPINFEPVGGIAVTFSGVASRLGGRDMIAAGAA